MADPLIVTQLREKQAEIERQIEGLNVRLADARANLLHVVGTIRLFDPEHSDDKPASAYHGANKLMGRRELFGACKVALEASAEALDTRELTRHVIRSEGWDTGDHRLYLTMAARIGATLTRLEKRGMVQAVGSREKATVWNLP